MTKRKKIIVIAGAAVILVALAISALFCVMKDKETTGGDFSGLSWTQAFQKLNQTMADEYAFTQWKGINWQELYDKYRPQIESAQAKNSFEDYYIALRSYLNEIPDGHVRMNNIADIDDKYIGGGFGFAAARLDNGKIIVTWVDQSGPAYDAGIRAGDELTEWNGQPIANAVETVSTVFAGTSATDEYLRQKQLAYLVRAPVGTEISLSVISPDSGRKRSLTLTAYNDNKQSLKKNYPNSVVSDKLRDMFLGHENPDPEPESIVEKKIIGGNICYIKLWAEFDADLQQTGKAVSTLSLMREAVAYANENKCAGMILDIRNNMGGLDDMAADILGLFYPEKTLYEYQKVYGSDQLTALYIQPAEQRFTGKIIALINSKCVSSGEGLAMGIKNLPNGETLGFFGTNGSFGLAGSEVKMPGGITVEFPSGQSLDKNKSIQLDSRNGIGGVSPSIRIPMTEQNAIRIAGGEDVELDDALRILTGN
ncbi:S41 family peptidase [Pelotomaculum propionicicum]|jgi:carboxyl-terminal processing protease|uniref:PDZ domain-containing protein n=1 Tax=Pelotomaculum propionicicum TaxID=258475 RepID=A0A4Y7RK46_9FIRM|nr:S41 family peptidase [Pelotomaculum propionicicum]NLI11275.1 PDZ domain-containing protein [Peptococcaceae bacterium]TEB09378.1 hypothetical protein Pmgp_03199 [Pelotomaculum propionicicum]